MNENPTYEQLTQRVKELERSEEKYRHLFETAMVGIYRTRLADGKFLAANDAMAKMIGYASVQALVDEYVTSEHYTDPNRRAELLKQLQLNGKVDGFEIEMRRVDGSRIQIALSARIYPDHDYLEGVIIDITERKRTENALRDSEQRYRSLVENTMAGYFICQIPSGHFIFLNEGFCNLYGLSMQEGLALNIWEVIAPDEHNQIRKHMREGLDGQPPKFASNVYGAIRKDGSEFRAKISTSLVTYQGKPVIQGVLRDVTEAERLQLQLHQAQKMEAVGTLAGGIAHDFNNLLMGIQGRASLMMSDLGPFHTHTEHLKGIKEYIKSASDLTKQLLGLARGGKYEIKPSDLNLVVKNSSQLFGRTKKEIRIHHNLLPDLWPAEVDRRQIEQVLLNIYVNAWQSMPAGGELYIQTENKVVGPDSWKSTYLEPGKYVRISIRDTGIGMDEETIAKIFDPFFTTKEMGRGTGLGLASAYGIIKNHGGIINVSSKKGDGTSFDIFLPATDRVVSLEPEIIGKLTKGTETILMVDDEQMIIDVGVMMLEKLGYKVIAASDGQEVLDIYQKEIDRIDIVILDLIMPGMNGGEIYDRLKKINPDIKVLLSSGYSAEGQAAEILKRGCNGFIQKPFDMIDLSHKLREIFDKN